MIIHSCLDNDGSPSGGLRSLWSVVFLPSGLLCYFLLGTIHSSLDRSASSFWDDVSVWGTIHSLPGPPFTLRLDGNASLFGEILSAWSLVLSLIPSYLRGGLRTPYTTGWY